METRKMKMSEKAASVQNKTLSLQRSWRTIAQDFNALQENHFLFSISLHMKC